MKKCIHSFYAFLLLVLCGCAEQKTTINFTLTGADEPVTVLVRKPINSHLLNFTDTLILAGHANVSLEISSKEVVPFQFYAGKSFYLLPEPGKTYSITLDYSDEKNKKALIDDPVQQTYMELASTWDIYQYEWVDDYTVAPFDADGMKMLANFEELAKKDKALFTTMEMSEQLRTAICNEIDLYRMALLSRVLTVQSYRASRAQEPMDETNWKAWNLVYEKYPASGKYISSSYLDTYLSSSYELSFYRDKVRFSSMAERLEKIYQTIMNRIDDRKLREVALAHLIYRFCVDNKTYDPEIISYIEAFDQQYPRNAYQKLFHAYVREIEEFQQVVTADFAPDIKIVDNYASLTTLREVIDLFAGKPLFIDFWFSTCGPCQREFKESAALKEYLKANDITMLYVSIDPETMEQAWQNIIKYNNLTGYHVRANQPLHHDMYQNYGIYSYPHYMIVDERGEIVLPRAAYPSSGDVLIDQIKEALFAE